MSVCPVPTSVFAVTAESEDEPLRRAAESALLRYHNDMRSQSLGRALLDSADAAAASLTALTQQHRRTVSRLEEHIASLQSQLVEAVSAVEALAQTASPSAARPSSYTVECQSSPSADPNQPRPFQQEEVSQPHEEISAEMALPPSDAFASAQSGSDGGNRPTSNDASLLAEVLQSRGTVRMQQQQQCHMATQLQELTKLLARVVRENAAQRQELQVLRATTVPMAVHQPLLLAHDALEQRWALAQVELNQLREAAELALQNATLVADATRAEGAEEREGDQAGEGEPMTSKGEADTCETRARDALAEVEGQTGRERAVAAPLSAGEGRHDGLWSVAMRELERQAILAASQQSAAAELREAESQIVALRQEASDLRAALSRLEEEDRCVRVDCEQLTFRNSVLVQQVASLLVQVERQRRSLRRKATRSEESISPSGRLTIEKDNDGDGNEDPHSSPSDKAKGIHPHDTRETRGETNSFLSLALRRRGRVASAAQELLERRQNVIPNIEDNGESGSNNPTHRGSLGFGRGSNFTLLDATLRSSAGPLEVEHGVRSSLAVFAAAPLLRNFGSPASPDDYNDYSGVRIQIPRTTGSSEGSHETEVEMNASGMTQVPKLPMTSELSGVALGRPPQFIRVDPREQSGATLTTRPSDEVAEDKAFLDLLREDEDLGRYSTNSVAELVRRNQELLQQLYLATRQADNKVGEGSASSETEAAHECKNAGSGEVHHYPRDGTGGSRKRPRTEPHSDTVEEEEEEEEEMVEEDEEIRTEIKNNDEISSLEGAGVYSNVSADPALVLSAARYAKLEAHVDARIDAVMCQHEAQQASIDASIAASLLRVMQLRSKDAPSADNNSDNNNNNNNNSDQSGNEAQGWSFGEVHSVMRDEVIASLVRLCAEQSVRAATQAAALTAAEESGSSMVQQDCWAESQRVLRETASELQTAIASIVQQHQQPSQRQHGGGSIDSATDAEIPVQEDEQGVKDEESVDEAQLLHHIASLLRAASLKEETVLRVLRLAERRRARLRRLEQKEQRRHNPHGRHRSRPHGHTRVRGNEEEGGEEVEVHQHTQPQRRSPDEVTHPDDAFPGGETDISPSLHRSDDFDGDEAALVRDNTAEGDEGNEDILTLTDNDDDDDEADDFDDDDDDDKCAQREEEEVEEDLLWEDGNRRRVVRLRAELAAAHDRYDHLLAAHHAEKRQHTLLLDRMWRLEEAAATATHDRDAAMERMSTMMTRAEYEATVGELDAARALVEELRDALRLSQTEATRTAADASAARAAAAQTLASLSAAQSEAAAQAAQREDDVVSLRRRVEQLESACRHQSARASAAEAALATRDHRESALRESLRLAELAVLERPCTQALLARLFPGDRALAESRPLVAALRAERERLAAAVAAAQAELAAARAEGDEWRRAVRAAAQSRRADALRAMESAAGTADADGAEGADGLRREVAALRAERAGWAEREAMLREALDALAHDPVSAAARRYGLHATRDFEAQLAELHVRVEAAEGLRGRLDAAEAALRQQEAAREAVRLALAEKEELVASINGAIATLEAEAQRMERRLAESEGERGRLYADNVRLMESVRALAEEVKRKETERRAAQTALAQGLANAAQRVASVGGSAVRGSHQSPGPMRITGSLSHTPG